MVNHDYDHPGKEYVDVIAYFHAGGTNIGNSFVCIEPLSIIWKDGREFEIDRISEVKLAASQVAGGMGTRYACFLSANGRYLFLEEDNFFLERPPTKVKEPDGIMRDFTLPLEDDTKTYVDTICRFHKDGKTVGNYCFSVEPLQFFLTDDEGSTVTMDVAKLLKVRWGGELKKRQKGIQYIFVDKEDRIRTLVLMGDRFYVEE